MYDTKIEILRWVRVQPKPSGVILEIILSEQMVFPAL